MIDYIYRFGRNIIGFYNFLIVLLIYIGLMNDGFVIGKRYDYIIYFEIYVNGNWYSENYELLNDLN